MAFKFQLGTVLDLQQQLEEMAKINFQNKTELLRLETDRLSDLREEQLSLYGHYREQAQTDVCTLRQLHSFALALNARIDIQKVSIHTAQLAVDQARDELAATRLEVKKLERLKHKQLTEFLYQEQRKEQAFLDDIATGRFIRQRQAL
ncbi:MAG: flagellar export protein FliJ [Peptococcaceae bacterium]|nr:flagellar export protein FliJ [Peptococcaceae bacterium]